MGNPLKTVYPTFITENTRNRNIVIKLEEFPLREFTDDSVDDNPELR